MGLDNGIICHLSHAPFPTLSAEVCSYYTKEKAFEGIKNLELAARKLANMLDIL